MSGTDYIRGFDQLGSGDVGLVGGKTASLGELTSALSGAGVTVPPGFAITAKAYRDALTEADAWPRLHELLDGLDKTDVDRLAERGAEARRIVYEATGGAALRREIIAAYRALKAACGGKTLAVAVRSSATAEDLPSASFAGQHESFLNVRGEAELVDACRRCFASIFTDRAIGYRLDNGFDHFKVYLSVAVMKMVRSDVGSSGVIFTLDTETGFRDVVFVTGAYGLGENIVQGAVDPDEFYVHKPTYQQGFRAVLRRRLGAKQLRMVYGTAADGRAGTRNRRVSPADRSRFCLTDDEVLALAGQAMAIEAHYSANAGRPTPMDVEWAKDGEDGRLYIVQARPETVASRQGGESLMSYAIKGQGAVLATGRAVGEKVAAGLARVVATEHDLQAFRPGEILVAETTTPDWQPVMKTAAAIVTDRGGRTCHAAIVARELGVPAVVGTGDATDRLKTGQLLTVSCAEGDVGRVYEGAVPFEATAIDLTKVPRPRTEVMLNLGDPDLAFRSSLLPSDGVGLARMEFIIQRHIGIHPMALAEPGKVTSARDRATIARATRLYAKPADFFVERLAEGVGTIAAAFFPRPVIVRLSDFKTNEYASLTGGAGFEPKEDNPMLGFRGASRYAHPAYAAGFALECAALKRVRETMGLTNLKIMVPFVRREQEARDALAAMASHGLARGENGLEVYVMCEIPNNVIRIDAFAALFDGFSIGSNDLTQLTLGVDRDSEIVAFDFDERDPGMMEMLRLAVTGARRNGRHVGICGEAPANYPQVAAALVGWGIDSISVNPSSLIGALTVVADAEGRLAAE
ncbi:MAG: phosphoenolpyruvate synthase [Caulobacteraceae bacterium]|nr:phosphoenolpyruvate synthase [Caulobacteraceae bacterium]